MNLMIYCFLGITDASKRASLGHSDFVYFQMKRVQMPEYTSFNTYVAIEIVLRAHPMSDICSRESSCDQIENNFCNGESNFGKNSSISYLKAPLTSISHTFPF